MLTIATVQVANYEKRGSEYLAKLYDGIRRYMPKDIPLRCVCFTDDARTLPPGVQAWDVPHGLTGWWNKLAMFRPGTFMDGERVLYFDLDTIPVDDLSDIAAYSGRFAILRDPYHPDHMGSSLMAWEAGNLDHIWTRWEDGGRPQFDPHGDQYWIETMQPEADYWQDMFPGQAVSFKTDCWLPAKIPDGARLIYFHGNPRPHQCQARYIKELWNRPPIGVDA